jgi:hypothetical protein
VSFEVVDEFADNIRASHPNLELAEDQMHALTIRCEQSERICPETCPLCEEWGTDVEKGSVRPISLFRRHLGRHLEKLALFVLPHADPDEESSGESSAARLSMSALERTLKLRDVERSEGSIDIVSSGTLSWNEEVELRRRTRHIQ